MVDVNDDDDDVIWLMMIDELVVSINWILIYICGCTNLTINGQNGANSNMVVYGIDLKQEESHSTTTSVKWVYGSVTQ